MKLKYNLPKIYLKKVVDTARVPGLSLTEFYAPFWFGDIEN